MTNKNKPRSIRFSDETIAKLKKMYPVISLPSQVLLAVYELDRIKDNKGIVTLILDEHLIEMLRDLAAKKSQTIENFLREQIVLEVVGQVILCPNCHRPQILKQELPDSEGDIKITCVDCHHTWQYSLD